MKASEGGFSAPAAISGTGSAARILEGAERRSVEPKPARDLEGEEGMMRSAEDRGTREAEARAERVDRVAVLYAQITAATREFLRAVAECDRHGDWAAEGFGSCAEWLAWRVGLQPNAARERVRVARALAGLPQTSEAMARGEVSFSKVRALTRVATAESEGELLDLARTGSAAHLERVVRAWKRLSRADEAKRGEVLHQTRRFSVVPDGEGMYVVRGRLTAEVAAVLLRAVEAASDALFEAASEEERSEIDPAQRRADAVGLISERALAAGMGIADAPVSGSRADRYQVLLHVEAETLTEDAEPGMSELEDGTRVSAETSRRLACDASVVTVTRGETVAQGQRADPSTPSPVLDVGRRRRTVTTTPSPVLDVGRRRRTVTTTPSPVLDVGRRRRTVTPRLRRALDARDRGCRFPGCGCRFTDAHHIEHWADGGETKLSNLVLLCRRHHRRVHEGGWRVCSDVHGTQIVFFTPEGRALAAAPPVADESPAAATPSATTPSATAPSAAAPSGATPSATTPSSPTTGPRPDRRLFEQFLRELAEREVSPDWSTNLPGARRDSGIPWPVEAAAWEALEDSAA